MDPKEVLNNPENLKLLINLLQSLLPNDDNTQVSSDVPEKNSRKPKTAPTKLKTKSRQRKGSDDEFENRFSSMPEFSMHKEDAAVDKKLSKHPPVARMREFEPVEVTCRICGKTEIVSPGLVFEGASRYKCNNCATQAG
jgi:hypothetical protein